MSATPHPLATARITVVDDDDYVREVTEMVFAAAGHSEADQTVRTFRVPILRKPFTREELSVATARVPAE